MSLELIKSLIHPRRKQYLVRPRMQLKIVSKLLSMMILFSIGLGFIAYIAVGGGDTTLMDAEASEAYGFQLRLIMSSIAATVLLGCAAIYVFGILVTQKIAGPLVPMERFLDELIKGNLETPDIHLRKGDELQELAQKLNELKLRLKERDPRRSTAA